jgi:FAD synthetase
MQHLITQHNKPSCSFLLVLLLVLISFEPCRAFSQQSHLKSAALTQSATTTTTTTTTTNNKYTRSTSTSTRTCWHRMAAAAAAADTTNTEIDGQPVQANNDNNLPNWREIPADAEDYVPFLQARPEWSQVQYNAALELHEKLINCQDSYVSGGILNALNCLDHAYRLYGPESVICSFNGGKDAVVILELVRAAHAKHYYSQQQQQINAGATDVGKSPMTTTMIRPRVVYFQHEDEFPQVLSFLRDSVQRYDLDMLAFEQGVKFSQGLEILVQNNLVTGGKQTFPMAFVLGTRSSDPNASGQDQFSPSSHWMPPFMRANPVLEWTYGHIWHFLRLFQLPYCALYDEGFTSLGTTKDTLPCPALLRVVPTETVGGDGGGGEDNSSPGASSSLVAPTFWPAYMLRDWDQERAGRIKKENVAKVQKAANNSNSNIINNPKSTIPRTVSTASDFRKSDPKRSMVEQQQQQQPSDPSASDEEEGASSVFTMDSSSEDPNVQKSVGLLIIGDEILKGQTVDVNTHAAAKAFRKENVLLSRVVVVSDDQEKIVKEIQRMQSEVDVIITSGGIGPTHDDVTIKSVAAALGREMVLHPEMAKLLKEKMNTNNNSNNKDQDEETKLTPVQIKMATLPSNAKLQYLSKKEGDWPVLQCRNIFILPGVPQFFSPKIENVAAYLSSQLERSIGFKVVLSVDETSIVNVLNSVVQKHKNVSFGSYPFVSHPEFKTVLTLEGSLVDNIEETFLTTSRNSTFFDSSAILNSKEQRDGYVRKALEDLIRELPKGSILRVDNDDLTPFT